MKNVQVQELTCAPLPGLPALFDLLCVGNFIGIQLKTLTWLTGVFPEMKNTVTGRILQKEFDYKTAKAKSLEYTGRVLFRKNEMYTTYKIPKQKPGQFRFIHEPAPKLKYVQRCLAIKLFSKFPLPSYVTGFVSGKGIRETAAIHAGKTVVVSLDIKDFFPSITQQQIYAFVLNHLGYPHEVARGLSELCTYHKNLPQGAPTSPVLSNIIGSITFDPEVAVFAMTLGFQYTRYADDLTFSSISEEVGKTPGRVDQLIGGVTSICLKHKFRISSQKTKIMRKHRRQWVLGQVVNQTPHLPREKYYALKAIVHNCLHNGIEKECQKTDRSPENFIRWVTGNLSFLKQIDEEKWFKLHSLFRAALESFKHGQPGLGQVELV